MVGPLVTVAVVKAVVYTVLVVAPTLASVVVLNHGQQKLLVSRQEILTRLRSGQRSM
jgi:hypothetical protein